MTRRVETLLRASPALAVVALAAMACRGAEPDTRPVPSGPARRVVSLVPAATEILFAIGAGDRLVGRTRWGVHPPEARSVPDVGDGVRPSVEAVLVRSPDLVILFDGPDTGAAAERLRALGVPVLSLTHNTLTDLYRNLEMLGEAVGCRASAARVAGEIREDLAELAGVTGRGRPVRVYYDVWPDPPMTIGRGSFLDSLVTLAGGQNVFGDLEMPSPVVSLEAVVQRDPEVMIAPVSGLSEEPAPGPDDARWPGRRPGWSAVRAVEEGRIAIVDADLLGRLGPRIGAAVRELAAAIRPDLSLPPTRALLAETCS